ncbi:MAG: OAM dimerization domain-containing protein [Eubacteriales bacterium]|nr:OAM dimerization domain-containing protein [Eubacteriales bacterium]MDD3611687.1 OAM dimerization domain-containing protein [Eubacteriales bacterium]
MHKSEQDEQRVQVDLSRLKPYGDTMNDGKVQLSFTLPIPDDERGQEAAKEIVLAMGLADPIITWHEAIDDNFTFYVAYGSLEYSIDYNAIQVETVAVDVMSMEETDDFIRRHFGRKIRVIGASTGTDAHTVGIDAIMNMKGYAGHFGLERYAMVEAKNLGSQVLNEDFIRAALDFDADVLLVSQTVTQKNVHVQNLTELVELLEAEGLRKRFLLIIGGPRINHELAKELGADAGFGPSKYADDVASYFCKELLERKEAGQ